MTPAARTDSGTAATAVGWLDRLRRGGSAAANLLFPPECVACEAACVLAPNTVLLCAACREGLARLDRPVCPRCALPCPPSDALAGPCPHCRAEKLRYDGLRTVGFYEGPLRQSVLKCKHAQHEPLADALGGLLAERIRAAPFAQSPELVVPVPMYWLTRWLRATNAAHTLAMAVGRRLGLPVAGDLLVCRRYLRRQAALRPQQRRANVRDAFRASWRFDIRGARILLVDDVLTTGATAHEASRALQAAGAAAIFVAAAARSAAEK